VTQYHIHGLAVFVYEFGAGDDGATFKSAEENRNSSLRQGKVERSSNSGRADSLARSRGHVSIYSQQESDGYLVSGFDSDCREVRGAIGKQMARGFN
jgi:hypothetical protein